MEGENKVKKLDIQLDDVNFIEICKEAASEFVSKLEEGLDEFSHEEKIHIIETFNKLNHKARAGDPDYGWLKELYYDELLKIYGRRFGKIDRFNPLKYFTEIIILEKLNINAEGIYNELWNSFGSIDL